MSDPTAPIHLPPLTFLMSDHTTATLAVEVAEVLSTANHTLYIDDFLAPIENAMQAMFDIDWQRDMGNPRETQRLMLEAMDGDSSERDILVSLERWFNDTFGELQLGRMGLKRMKVNRDLFAYPYLFRDATPKHIQPFLNDSSIARRDILMVNLNPELALVTVAPVFNVSLLTWDTLPDVTTVIKSISEACR